MQAVNLCIIIFKWLIVVLVYTPPTGAALKSHFRTPEVFVPSRSCPCMAPSVHGPYLNSEPDPWLPKDSEHQQAPTGRRLTFNFFFHPIPGDCETSLCLEPQPSNTYCCLKRGKRKRKKKKKTRKVGGEKSKRKNKGVGVIKRVFALAHLTIKNT